MITRQLVIILDAAHGEDVAGKCSPDKSHYEWQWSRKIIGMLMNKLPDLGFKVEITNPSKKEIGLSKRKENANSVLLPDPGHSKKLLISLHNNAAGDGSKWTEAEGYELYTSRGSTISDKYAEIFIKHLREDFKGIIGIRERIDPLKEANFTVLMGNYGAILIEWLFMDNKEDLERLKDDNCNYMLVSSLIKALIDIDEHLDCL